MKKKHVVAINESLAGSPWHVVRREDEAVGLVVVFGPVNRRSRAEGEARSRNRKLRDVREVMTS